jgi:hypothetical protein
VLIVVTQSLQFKRHSMLLKHSGSHITCEPSPIILISLSANVHTLIKMRKIQHMLTERNIHRQIVQSCWHLIPRTAMESHAHSGRFFSHLINSMEKSPS